MGLSSTACEMLLVLKEHLHTVQQLLSKPLFTMFWQRLAEDMDQFLYNKVSLVLIVSPMLNRCYNVSVNIVTFFSLNNYVSLLGYWKRYMLKQKKLISISINSVVLFR